MMYLKKGANRLKESADSQVLRVERRLEVDVSLVLDVHGLDRVVAAQQEVVR